MNVSACITGLLMFVIALIGGLTYLDKNIWGWRAGVLMLPAFATSWFAHHSLNQVRERVSSIETPYEPGN
jgi:hypothetical protein